MVAVEKGVVAVSPPILRSAGASGGAFQVNGVTHRRPRRCCSWGRGAFGYAVWTRGRDRRYQGSPVDQVMGNPHGGTQRVPIVEGDASAPVEFGPPEGIKPGQVGTLIDERANTLDVSATIVDLAVRGYLLIQEIPKEGLFGKPDWRLVRLETRRPTNCRPTSGCCWTGCSAMAATSRCRRCARRSSERLQTVEDSLYSDAKQQGWFTARPDKVRGRLGARRRRAHRAGDRGRGACSRCSPGSG